ncbi:hypothetical protein D0C36_21040 [Mucilaginibacter conchicola]|uniref:Bacteriophage abortive infection AbiH n=1 Tax=Mucilaginibacter conchicola TaxID=2303333 RepID=A0A372NMW8_9SPHI|nr:bacteriophage abortive infection AbiH family protein [Mucilaginibacter conchicola]RFZ90286.1 hypothetical protein D0C36_21040 [Mucilaginibacter conchicola]
MKKLYIIGNGFDLYHSLPSRYADFHQHIAVHEPDLLQELDSYFNFRVDKNYLWSNFEQDLCHFNHKRFMAAYNHIDIMSDSFKPSEFYSLFDEVTAESERLAEQIRGAFREWVEAFELDEIDHTRYTPLLLDQDAAYINFNYTDTLEEIYQIPKNRILYIHHNANAYDGELIFGHGKKRDQKEIPTIDEGGEPTRTPYTDSENTSRSLFYVFQKNTKEVLKEHRKWFGTLKKVEEVIILGHSIGRVDWPYFKEISKQAPLAEWIVSYYGEKELAKLKKYAARFCRHQNIQMITFNDII